MAKKPMDGKLAHAFDLMPFVEELRSLDHAFVTKQGANFLSKPFGFEAATYVAKANPNDPKGLTFNNGATEAEGIDAQYLAMQICDHVGVAYESKFGRGSQLRACCDALEAWLKTE